MAINAVMDLETGKPLSVAVFGKNIKITAAVVERAKTSGTPVSDKAEQLGSSILQIFYDFGKVVPYRVGSTWDLSVNKEGEISLKELKE